MWNNTSEGIVIAVKVVPKAHRNEILGWENGELKIRVAAQPDKGRANTALLAFLSDMIGISKSRIRILSGETSRHKKILFSGLNSKELLVSLHNLNIDTLH